MMRRGSWTSARAIAVRCCSPPGQRARQLACLGGQADERQHPIDGRGDLAPGRAGHLERERDVLPDGLRRQELEVLEDDPDLPPDPRDLAASKPGEVLAVEDHDAVGRELVADQQPDQGGLAGAGRSDEEDEVALGHDQVDIAQGDIAVRIGLRDVMEDHDRAIDRRLGRGEADRPGPV